MKIIEHFLNASAEYFLPGELEPSVHTQFLEDSKPVLVDRMRTPINNLDNENVA